MLSQHAFGRLAPCASRDCQRAASAPARGRGFSLVELSVVMVVIGIASAIAIPRFGNSIANARLNSAVLRIQRDFAMARQRAVARSSSVTIVFGAQGYGIAGITSLDRRSANYTVVLTADPYAVSMGAVNLGGDTQLTFDMYGVPDSGGTISLSAGNIAAALSVDPATGEVTRP